MDDRSVATQGMGDGSHTTLGMHDGLQATPEDGWWVPGHPGMGDGSQTCLCVLQILCSIWG